MNRIKKFYFPFCLVLLGIGILLLGAWDMQKVSAARFNTWWQAESLPEPMAGASIQCPDQPEVIYMVGGVTTGGQTSNRFYKYDATQQAGWTRLPDLPIPLRGQAVACYQGRIYVAGGLADAMDHLYIYKIIDNGWFQGADLPDETGGANLGAWDGRLYLMGGSRDSGLPYTPVGRVDVYDIATDTWTADAGDEMPTPTAYAYSGVQRGHFYFITGGISGNPNSNVDKTQRYDMANNAWEQVGFPSARGITASSMTASSIYVQGGDVNGGSYFDPTNLVEFLDLSLWPGGPWTNLGDPLPRASLISAGACTEAIAGGEIWAIGGADENLEPFADVYYRPTEACFDFFYGDLPREEWELGNHPGGTAHYVIPLVNNGTITDTFDVSISSTWVYSSSLSVGPVGPGLTALVMVDIEVPADALPGEYDVATLMVTSQGDPEASDSAQLTTSVTEWQEAANVPIDIAFHNRAQCINDPNGFYVLGGGTPDLWTIEDIYYYNAVDNNWTWVTYLPRGGGWGHITACYDNKLYVLGSGFTYFLDVYDIASDTWTYAVSTAPRDPFTAGIGVWDGELFMVGGTDEVDIYNIAENIWSNGPTMPAAPWGFGSAQAGQYLYVVGGESGDWLYWNDNLDITLRLDMENKVWETGPSFPSRRGLVDLGVSESHLYAIGGDINGGERLDPTGMVEMLDLSEWPEGEWEDINQPLPWALEANSGGNCTEARAGGEVWSVGGASGTWAKLITIDNVYYLPIGESCVQNIVNVSDIPMQGEGEIGHTVEYTIDITNTGNITDYYYLDPETTWPAYFLMDSTGPVAPGETIQVVLDVDVPLDVHVGDQGTTVLTVYSLRDPNIMDSIHITTNVVGNDIHLDPDALEQDGIYGETITYTLVLQNQGDITDTVSISYTGSTWEVVLPVTSFELGIGGSAEVVVNVTIPLDVELGDMDDFDLIATSAGNSFVTDSTTLTTTALWHRMLLPLAMRN